jgi:hypothetical protein
VRDDDMYEELLTASIADNIAGLLHVFEQEIPIGDVHAPAAAEENARRMAQRQVPIVRLVRAYRIAHGRFLPAASNRSRPDRMTAN